MKVQEFFGVLGHLGVAQLFVQIFHHAVESVLAAYLRGRRDIGVDAGRNLLVCHAAVLLWGEVVENYSAGSLKPLALLSVPTLDTDVDDVINECNDGVHVRRFFICTKLTNSI